MRIGAAMVVQRMGREQPDEHSTPPLVAGVHVGEPAGLPHLGQMLRGREKGDGKAI